MGTLENFLNQFESPILLNIFFKGKFVFNARKGVKQEKKETKMLLTSKHSNMIDMTIHPYKERQRKTEVGLDLQGRPQMRAV